MNTNFTNGQWSARSPNLDLADEKEADQRDDDEGQREVPHQLLGDDLNTDWMHLIGMTFSDLWDPPKAKKGKIYSLHMAYWVST